MPPHGEWKYHDARFRSTYKLDECFPRCFIVGQMRVTHSRVQSYGDAKRPGGTVGFRGARGGVSARSHFPLGEIDDSDAMPGLDGLGERAAARELDVVAMRGNGEEVDVLTHIAVPRRDRASPHARPARCRTPGPPGSRPPSRSRREP